MTTVSKNVSFDVLDDIVNKYNSTVQRTIKMKSIDVTSVPYAEYNEGSNEKDPKSKVGDRVRISKYKNIFIISKIKDIVPLIHVIGDLNGQPITMKKKCKKLVKKNLE